MQQAPASPPDPFLNAREAAKQLDGTAKSAGTDAVLRLQGDVLRETFGLSGAPAYARAASAAAEGATRSAARMLAESANKQRGKKMPAAAVAMLKQAVMRPPAVALLLLAMICND